MKIRHSIFLVVIVALLSLALLFVVGGAGDEILPRSFTVSFITGDGASQIPAQTVKEGYRIEAINDPTNDKTSIFRGWYTDKEYTEPFDVENHRVFKDLTLYAKWSFPTKDPSEFALTSDAFTRSFTWIQTGVSASDIEIYAIRGAEEEVWEWDERLEQNVLVGTKFTYNEANREAVSGQISVSNNQLTFAADGAFKGGSYKIIIKTLKDGIAEVAFEDALFKGLGTEEDPYLIYTAEDLTYITTHSFDKNTVAKLMADKITLYSVYSDKRGCVYDGKFDGNGKTVIIKNNSGMFYELGENAEVYNLTLKGSIAGSDPSLGVLANYSNAYIHDVRSLAVSLKSTGGKVNDFSTLSKGGAGGIVGTNLSKGRITGCQVEGAQDNTINGRIGVGCIAGINYGRIYNMTINGIVGAYNGNEISQTINNTYAGVIVGVNFGEISKIYSEGKANSRRIPGGEEGEGANNVGGIAGYNAKGGIISECFFAGMRCVGDTNVGGIAGYNDGRIENCYSGRRLRRPSDTDDPERQFISPVTGSYNVGGIAGGCGPNSVITNVFSTANVWAYGERAYAIAEKADNAVYLTHNQNRRDASRWLGQKYGVVVSDELLAPVGENTLAVDNSNRQNLVVNHLLGWDVQEVENEFNGETGIQQVKNEQLCSQILGILGSKYVADSTWGIVLSWNR